MPFQTMIPYYQQSLMITTDNKSFSTIPVKLHFIASPYCEWIIGYNNNNDNSAFYCIAPSDKAFDMTPDIFDKLYMHKI